MRSVLYCSDVELNLTEQEKDWMSRMPWESLAVCAKYGVKETGRYVAEHPTRPPRIRLWILSDYIKTMTLPEFLEATNG